MKIYKTIYRLFGLSLILFINVSIFAQTTEFLCVTPVSGSKYLNPEQNIILKTDLAFKDTSIQTSLFQINGSKSGFIDFRTILSADLKTLILKPNRSFVFGEKITVKIFEGLKTVDGSSFSGKEFYFYIKEQDNLQFIKDYYQGEKNKYFSGNSKKEGKLPNKERIKSLDLPIDFPLPTFVLGDNLDDNYIFMDLSNRQHPVYSPYHAIFDKYGTPIYYQRTSANHMNFYVLPNGLLTYSSNSQLNPENEKYYLMDSSYVVIDSVETGNGYIVDFHDMRQMSNGHYLMMSYDPQVVNMSLIVPGGQQNAIVTGLIIQEVDLDQNVYFQWRSWDHFEITDATYDINLTANKIDYVHGNALEFDLDSNILLSSRNMDEITKIDYPTGEIIWRFGRNCENNQFVINNDPYGFSHQHDIRVLENGNYTLFDNGNLHSPPFSQAMEYNVNENTMQVDLVWSYRYTPDIFAHATGSFRVQENGKRLIGWGINMPLASTELNSDTTISTDIYLPMNVTCYRTLKFDWETNKFYSDNKMSFGNYAGYSTGKELLLYITNNSDHEINITSTHNYLPEFYLSTNLPLNISPNTSNILKLVFEPTEEGSFVDLLTINYDNADNTRRIARQVELFGTLNNEIPSVFFDPENGSVNVDPESELIVTFDEPVRKIWGAAIQNTDIPIIFELREDNNVGDEVSFTGIISEDKMQITIFPTTTLKNDQQYYLELHENRVEDFDGNIINYEEVCYFTTGNITTVEEMNNDYVIITPNPFSEFTSILINNKNNLEVKLDIYDLIGNLVIQDKFNGDIYQLSSEKLVKGVYLLKISSDKIYIKKLVVQ
ncbi:MAG: aryl-sulfate sulfotransferase [Bacteroidales bacterium]|nr:aryl-sulfate sulfotransferase [Bacteroidales bacterium]